MQMPTMPATKAATRRVTFALGSAMPIVGSFGNAKRRRSFWVLLVTMSRHFSLCNGGEAAIAGRLAGRLEGCGVGGRGGRMLDALGLSRAVETGKGSGSKAIEGAGGVGREDCLAVGNIACPSRVGTEAVRVSSLF